MESNGNPVSPTNKIKVTPNIPGGYSSSPHRAEFDVRDIGQINYGWQIDWANREYVRGGVIPFTEINGNRFYAFGLDSAAGTICDFGGSREIADLDILDTALREFEEESLGVFGRPTREQIQDRQVLLTESMVLILLPVKSSMTQYSIAFARTVLTVREPEIRTIVWLSRAQLVSALKAQHSRGTRIIQHDLDSSLTDRIIATGESNSKFQTQAQRAEAPIAKHGKQSPYSPHGALFSRPTEYSPRSSHRDELGASASFVGHSPLSLYGSELRAEPADKLNPKELADISFLQIMGHNSIPYLSKEGLPAWNGLFQPDSVQHDVKAQPVTAPETELNGPAELYTMFIKLYKALIVNIQYL
jgi:hypothetical protein